MSACILPRRCNSMKKKKKYTISKSIKERIGYPTGLMDCNGDEILTGDYIHLKSFKFYNYVGPVLWNREQKRYGIFSGLWYGDKNPLNPDSYGKFISIPKDNGMRMELIPVPTK